MTLRFIPPRLISREAAAAYVCVSPNTFDEMVKDRRMPRPRRLVGRRKAWDIRELDEAVDNLPIDGNEVSDETWSNVDGP
jgi:predicted DNA-binding transcriptional regulator AlpA